MTKQELRRIAGNAMAERNLNPYRMMDRHPWQGKLHRAATGEVVLGLLDEIDRLTAERDRWEAAALASGPEAVDKILSQLQRIKTPAGLALARVALQDRKVPK